MTETSPVAALAYPPRHAPTAEAMALRATAGRIITGVELRLMDTDGNPPTLGRAGDWRDRRTRAVVTAGYYRE